MSSDFLSPLKRSFVFYLNSNPGGPERMARDRGRHASVDRSKPDYPVSAQSAGLRVR